MFGQPSGGFGFGSAAPAGAPGGFGFGAAPAAPAFGQSTASPFGAPAPAPAFGGAPAGTGFGTSAPSLFGSAPATPFGAPAPATPGIFGAPAPATGGFGGTTSSPFGAPAPATSPFGGTGSTFGGSNLPFGSSPNKGAFGAASTPGFGAANPFAAKPQASPFGTPGTNPFGAPAPATPFGAPAPTAGAFGSFGGSTPFGAPAATTGGFGAPAGTSPFGAPATAGGFGVGSTGTGQPPYQPVQERESTPGAPNQMQNFNYVAITKMPAYQGKSFEELRYEDYAKGNKGTAPAGGFGTQAASPFGAPASPFGATAPAASPFGSTAAPAATPFGGFAAAPAASPFGAPKAPFGAPAATSPFGAPAASPFGAPAATSPFGAPAPAASPFGAPAPASNPFAPKPGTTTSPFGASALSTPSPFGAPAATAASPFGAAPAANPFAKPAGGTSLFGATSAAPAANPFALGGTPAAAPNPFALGGAPAVPSLFGSTPAAAPGASPFGAPAVAPTGAVQYVLPQSNANPYAQLPPAPSTNPYPYGKHSLFKPADAALDSSTANVASAPAAAAPVAAATTSLFGGSAPAPALGAFNAVGTTTAASAGLPPSTDVTSTSAKLPATCSLGFGVYAGVSAVRTGEGAIYGANCSKKLGVGLNLPRPWSANGGLAPPSTAFEATQGSNATSSSSIGAVNPSASRIEQGGIISPLNPLIAFRSPRALDIDVDALADPTTSKDPEPTGIDRTSEPEATAAAGPINTSGDFARPSNPVATVPPSRLHSTTPSVAAASQQTPATRQPVRSTASMDAAAQIFSPQPRPVSNVHADHRRGEVPQQTIDELGRVELTQGTSNLEPAEPDDGILTEDTPTGRAEEDTANPSEEATEEAHEEVMISRPLSRDQLRRRSLESLAAVEDFELEVPGLGSLHWPGVTDLRTVRDTLDQVVKFDSQKVKVYPDGMAKPAVGQALNKRAVYTMQGIWPRDKQTKAYMLDHRSVAALRSKLQRKAEAMSAHHLSYDGEMGEWRVQIDHF